jgi:Flp pilus assembly protein TadD
MEELLKKAVELDPARLRGYGLLARLYVRQNRLVEAERQFQEIIARNPTSVGTNTMLGMLLEMRGKAAEAEKQYEKVLAIDGNAAVAANNLAYIYADQGRNLDQALQLAQTAQRGLPNEANAIDTLGWVYYRKGMSSAAVRELETAVKINPKDPTLLFHLGMAYNQAGEIGKARTTLKEALSLGQFAGADEARKTLAGLGG